MKNNKEKKINNFFLSFIIGLILPAIAVLIFYFTRTSYNSLKNFILINLKYGKLSGILTFCLMINVPIIYYSLKKEYYKAARGTFLAVIIWTILILYLNFS